MEKALQQQSGADGHELPEKKKSRRKSLYYLLFLVWIVIGTGLFFHIWENRTHYGNAFTPPAEEESGP